MGPDYLISHKHIQTDKECYLFDRLNRTKAVIALRILYPEYRAHPACPVKSFVLYLTGVKKLKNPTSLYEKRGSLQSPHMLSFV